jgi:hypothetical protein
MIALFAIAPSPVRSELPEAPPPRAKKTTAELLVGTWKMSKSSHLKLGPDIERRIRFAANRRFFFRWDEPGFDVREKTGTYSFDGRMLRITDETGADRQGKPREVIIEFLNKDEFRITSVPPEVGRWDIYRRVEAK